MILEMNPKYPQPRKVDKALDVLRQGGLIAYPTDSVYGIGCDIFNRDAVDKLHKLVRDIKGKADHAPLSFICRDLANIAEYAMISDYSYRALRRLLPGPYTFILKSTKLVPKIMRNKRKTVGIRIPDASIPDAIVTALGNPMATTSAALADGEFISDPWTLQDMYGHAIDLVIDGGYLFPEPTTVIDFTDDYPQLIRQGKGDVGGVDFVEFI